MPGAQAWHMAEHPYTILSAAVSLDGRLDDGSERRLVLSDAEDLDRVDAVRASCDAILVGAGTIRADNPRLLVRDAARRAARSAAGLSASPTRVTLTRSGDLDPDAAFFTTGGGERLVLAPAPVSAALAGRLRERADVVPLDPATGPVGVLDVLAARGVGRLLVEGGSRVLTAFLTAGAGDELHLVVAPFFVGSGPRFAADGAYPWTSEHRARTVQARTVGGVALLRVALSARCTDVATRGEP